MENLYFDRPSFGTVKRYSDSPKCLAYLNTPVELAGPSVGNEKMFSVTRTFKELKSGILRINGHVHSNTCAASAANTRRILIMVQKPAGGMVWLAAIPLTTGSSHYKTAQFELDIYADSEEIKASVPTSVTDFYTRYYAALSRVSGPWKDDDSVNIYISAWLDHPEENLVLNGATAVYYGSPR